MTHSQIILGFIVIAWFLLAVQISSGFRKISDKQDAYWKQTFEHFEGLREYLYEIDPQFDDERELLDGLHSDRNGTLLDGKLLIDLEKEKRESGKRTLSSHFRESGFRSPRQKDFQG